MADKPKPRLFDHEKTERALAHYRAKLDEAVRSGTPLDQLGADLAKLKLKQWEGIARQTPEQRAATHRHFYSKYLWPFEDAAGAARSPVPEFGIDENGKTIELS